MGLDARVYADESTLPAAEAYEHVGIATTPGELQQQWQRFRFADVPPVIDTEQRDVLFIGFGESGSCPVVFGGLSVEGSTVRLVDDQSAQACTADYNPRTIAVSVAAGALPDGFLTVDMPADAADVTISLAGSEQPPPATPNPVSASITDVSLIGQPAQAPIGTVVDVLIRNDTGQDSVATGQRVTIDRWNGHHFETLGWVSGGDDLVEVGPQETGQLMELDTGDPAFPTGEAGWFRLTASLDVTTGGFGRLNARMNLHLTEQIAEVPPGLSITAGPPCNDTGACPAGVLIDGVFYLQSCGLIDPAAVSDQVYATGEGITAYVLDDVDPRVMLAWETTCEHYPRVMLAWETTCEPPMDGRWHVLSAADRSRTPENEAAWCRVSLHGGDPAEGFDC